MSEIDPSSGLPQVEPSKDLARMAVEVIDSLPPPRHIESEEATMLVSAGLGRFTVDGLTMAFNAPHRYPDGISTTEATAQSLRASGERVGPFRIRKIRKILELT